MWFGPRTVPGVHYEQLHGAMDDLLSRSRSLVREFQAETAASVAAAGKPGRLQRMARDAAAVSAESFHGLAQLDAFAWAVQKSAAAQRAWPPEAAPGPGGRWRRLVFPESQRILSQGMPPAARRAVAQLRAGGAPYY